jgi:hypothetical protein
MDNETRADAALACLETFKEHMGQGLSMYDAVTDLICNLGHFAVQFPGEPGEPDDGKIDFRAAVEKGLGMWSAEQRDGDDDPMDNDRWACIEITPDNEEQLLALRPDKIDLTKGEPSDGDDDDDDDPECACQNCDWKGPESELKPIKDIGQRVAPGEPMPSGECPECGCLCHPVREG